MKHIMKVVTLLVAITALWIGLLDTSIIPRCYTWLLPLYLIVSLGCYGLLMVGIGLIQFPTCPQEAVLLQKDIIEAKKFLKQSGVDDSALKNSLQVRPHSPRACAWDWPRKDLSLK